MTQTRRWRRRPAEERYRQISEAIRPAKDPRPTPHARRRVEAYSAGAFAAFLVFDQTVRQAFRRPSDVAATVLPGAGARRPGGHASWCSFPHGDILGAWVHFPECRLLPSASGTVESRPS